MAWDKTWETLFSARPWGKYPGEDVIRFVARYFYKSPDRSAVNLLEVGSGTGANLWFMAREGFSIYGVDGSNTAVDLSRARLNEEVPDWKGSLQQGDIVSLPFPDNYFDAVLDIEACYANNFDDAKRIYTEMVRVLKPGGKFYSRCFAKGSSGDETGSEVGYNAYIASEGPAVGTGLARFTSRADIDALLPSSLKIIELDTIERGALIKNHIIEWCITAEKFYV